MRRQLSKSQLAIIAVRMLPPLKEEARKRQATSTGGTNPQLTPISEEAGIPGEAVAHAAQIVGVGRTQVAEAKIVVECAPELVPDIEAGKLSARL